jgi:mitochondrial fission protein ELM1
MGRVTNVNDEKTSRMQLNLSLGVANYLIANVDMIDTVMENTYERIKQGQLAEDNIKSHKAIYTAIQNGTFSLNDDNLDAFKRSLDKQFSKDEKDMFTRMRSRTIQSVDQTYREDIVRLYLVTKGPQFVAAQK